MAHIQMLVKTCIDQIIQQNPVVKNIFAKIYEQQGRVLLVGGIVRDCLLQQSGSDLDFEVYHISFDQLQTILATFGPVSFVGQSFGVLRLHTLDADWSIPRKDSSGRKPKVDLDPDMSFVDAFKRRDLTINAMGIDVKTLELIDPYGGLQDLKHAILKTPDALFFVQDPLRLFRVMQFAARLHMKPDQELNIVCKNMDISTISKERIDEEFKKLFLKSTKPSIGFYWLQKIERFDEIFPMILFQDSIMNALDCFAKTSQMPSPLKLSCMWALFACGIKDSTFNQIQVTQSAVKNDIHHLKVFIQQYVLSSEIVDCAAVIAWYVHYIPLVLEQENVALYKWLAFWISKVCNLEKLATVGSCLYAKGVIDLFLKNANNAGVLKNYEQPLVQGKDLLHLAQGKELGDLVKHAYKLQLDLGIVHKQELLKRLTEK